MKSLEDFSRHAGIIPEEKLPALHSSLKRIPDFSWLLDKPHPELDRLQGDLIRDFPTAIVTDAGEARAQKFTVMILNNSCDLPDDRSNFVTAAPIVDFDKFIEFEKRKRGDARLTGFIDAVRRNDKTELLYLPKIDGFPNGALVLLHLVCSVSAELYKAALNHGGRVASFTQTGFYFLLIKLTTHLARAESAEVQRS